MSDRFSPTTREALDKDGLVWLLVGCFGFFFGFAWVTGPLGWYFARRLKNDARDAGVGAPDVVRAAHIVGIVTTVVTYAALVIIAVVAVVFFGVFAGTQLH